MRIISDFHDYYDGVQKSGQDQTLIYHRHQSEMTAWPSFPDKLLSYLPDRLGNCEVGYRGCIVGFCGRVYPLVCLETWRHGQALHRILAYCMEEVDAFVTSLAKKRELERYRRPCKYFGEPPRRRDFDSFFTGVTDLRNRYEAWFREHRCPSFLYDPRGCVFGVGRDRRQRATMVCNPRLADIEFYRVIDPYTAFQEIQMFLGGLAAPEKTIPKISDKDMIEIKGFDKKWSFRKEPRKPKR
jgi:hypothetical protein